MADQGQPQQPRTSPWLDALLRGAGGGPRRGGKRKPRRGVRIYGGRGGGGGGRYGRGGSLGGPVVGPANLLLIGYSAYQYEKKLISDIEKAQLERIEQQLKVEDIRAKQRAKAKYGTEQWQEKFRNIRLQKHYQAVLKKNLETDYPAHYYPGYEPPVFPKPLPVPLPGGARAPPGTRVSTATAAAAPASPGAAVATKEKEHKYRELVKKALSSKYFLPALGIAGAILARPRAGAYPTEPQPAYYDSGLTDFQPEPLFSGTLGGVPVGGFSEEAMTEDALATGEQLQECEKIDPPRTPGECRQGWFAESPTALYLKEWSRRPCQ